MLGQPQASLPKDGVASQTAYLLQVVTQRGFFYLLVTLCSSSQCVSVDGTVGAETTEQAYADKEGAA